MADPLLPGGGFTRDGIAADLPAGWSAAQVDDVIALLKPGPRYDKKTALESGCIPILDQTLEGVIGFHNDPAGVAASAAAPVVTFANHTCNMRLMVTSFSSIQNVFAFRGVADVSDTDFLYYWLRGRISTDSYRGHFPSLRSMWLPLPPLPSQRRIAALLKVLDDLIDTNQRLVATARELAACAYSTGSTTTVPFSDVATLSKKSIKHGEIDRGTTYVGLEHLASGGSGIVGTGIADDVGSSKVTFSKGDVLYGKLRPYFRKVDRPGFDGVASSEAWVLKPADGYSAEFLFSIVHSQDFTDWASQGSEGTRMPRAGWRHVSQFPAPVPPKATRARADVAASQVWEAIWNLTQEIAELRRTRDELLPLLMSGAVSPGEVTVAS